MGWLESYPYPGPIAFTFGGSSMSPATRDVKLFLEPLPRCWECRIASPISTALAMVELNRQAASDEKVKIGEGAVRDPGMLLRRVSYLR